MIKYECDGCGKALSPQHLRYSVTIDVRAAYEAQEIGLAELVQDHKQEILELIQALGSKSTQEVEESVYKQIRLDLCPSCQKAYISDPLRIHPEQSPDTPTLDMDAFLRSLGYGDESTGEPPPR